MTLQESAVDVFGGPKQPKKAAEPDLKVAAPPRGASPHVSMIT